MDELTEAVQAFLTLAAALPELDDPAEGIAACGAAYDALTSKEKAREDVAAAYAAFLAVVAEFNEPMVIPESAAVSAVYVSKDGSDETGDGSQANPYASLAKVSEVVNADTIDTEFVIYVMSDLTSEACARFYNHDVTITSLGDAAVTVTRGEEFATQLDNARSWYNPALIEIGGAVTGEPVASLRLENIVLDDAGLCMGKYFTQADSEGDGKTLVDKTEVSNSIIVQDAMIATYNGTGKIIMGEGAVLRNFGGMSAVRLAGGELVMEDGSVIEDTTVTDRTKGSGGNGPAGAIWIQGGEITMEKDSVIQDVIGRAIYVDSGKAEIGGTIQNIKSDSHMWQETKGFVLHLRGEAEATLKGDSLIDNSKTETASGSAVYAEYSDFTTEDRAVISNFDVSLNGGFNLIYGDHATIYIDGKIANNNTGRAHVAQLWECTITIDENAYIHDNTSYYGVFYLQKNNTMDVYGTFKDNVSTGRGGAIVLNNNCGSPDPIGSTVNIYDPAVISGNTSAETGGGIMVQRGLLTMYGGTISDNTAKTDGGGIYIYKDDTGFVMKDGLITNNSAPYGGGIAIGETNPSCILEGGTITGNTATVAGNDLAVALKDRSSGYAHINGGYMELSPEDLTLGDPNVYIERLKATVKVDTENATVKLGNSHTSWANKMIFQSENKGWSNPLGIFWMQSNSGVVLTVRGLNPTANLPVYSLVMDAGVNGQPANDTECKVYATTVASDGSISFTIPNSYTNGCAVALVQPTEDFGSVVVSGPAKITEVEGAQSYEVEYTITYTMSDTLKSMIDNGAVVGPFTLTLEPDAALTADVLTTDAETLTVKAVLPAEKFAVGESLFTTGNVKMTVNNVTGEIYIPANVVKTQMVALKRYTVTFDANGGTLADGTVTPVTVIECQKVTQPADPTRSGYTFSGWYLNGAKYDFSQPVTGDITLVADWERIESSSGGSSGGSGRPATNTKVKGLNTKDHIAYVAGYPDGTVRPEGDITRAEMAAIFVNLMTEEYLKEYYSVRNPYLDVASDAWYNPFVSTMYEAGAIKDSEDYFRPNEPITRAELAVMAAQFATSKAAKASTFSDVSKKHWAADEIALIQKMGWISGYPDGTFRPDNNITRAEAMAIINHMLERSVEEEHMLEGMIKWIDNPSSAWYYEIVQEATNGHTYKRTNDKVGGNDYYYERWIKLLND